MDERSRGIAVSALRLVVGLPIMFGLRMAFGAEIALPPQVAVEISNETPLSVPVLVAQAQSIPGGISQDAGGVSATATTTEPQSSTQESISVPSMPGISQKRRRPRMAGIPDGLRTVDQFPDESTTTQQATGQEQQPVETGAVAGTASSQQGAAQGNEEEDTETMPITETNSPGARAALKAKLASSEGRKYKLAPISWRGTVFYSIAWRKTKVFGNRTYLANERPDVGTTPYNRTSIVQVKGAIMEGSTFVLHPWVATVGGHLGVIQEDDHPIPRSSNTHNNQLIYGAETHIFPVTRFPFSMFYDHRTNKADYQSVSQDFNNDTMTDTLRISQKYQPLRGPDIYNFAYSSNKTTYNYQYNNLSIGSQMLTGAYKYSTLSAAYSTRLGRKFNQPFNLYANHTVASQSLNHAADTVTDNIRATHRYVPEEYLLTLSTDADYFASRNSKFTSRNLSVGSSGTWQPEDLDNPLIVTGKAKYYRTQYKTDISKSDNQILTASVNATYNKWSYLRLTGGGGLTETHRLGGGTNLITILFGRAYYTPPATRLANYAYRKSFSSGFTNTTSSSGNANFATSTEASHNLSSRGSSFRLLGRNFLYSNQLSQSLFVRTDRLRGSSETLVNGATLRWVPLGLRSRLPGASANDRGMGVTSRARIRGSANLITAVKVSARDVRTFGRRPSHSTYFRLSLNGGAGSAYSGVGTASGYGATAELGIDYSYTTRSGGSGGLQGNASWGHSFYYDYRYKRRKVFNVPRLNYTFRLRANLDPSILAQRRSNLQSTQVYATDSQAVGYGGSLQNLLTYRIGQNMVVLSSSIVNDYGVNTASLFLQFRAWRNLNN